MPKQFLIALCLLLSACAFAQNTVTLTGTLDVNTGESFPYKLVLTETNGNIKGYSLTYKEPNETKTAVTGKIDRQNRVLTFKETSIVYSSGYHTKAYMCLIDARLDYVQSGMGTVLKGYITSKEADKTQCTGGTITFGSDAEIMNLFSYHDAFDTVITMKKKMKVAPVAATAVQPAAKEPVTPTEEVTKGIVKTYDWHSDTVTIAIWDGGNVDGDRVTLQYNGKDYLTNYSLVKEKKLIRIPVSAHGVDVLTIIADNEGSEPPNTASILLADGNTRYSILAYNNKGDKAVIKIKKVAAGVGN